MTYYPLHPITSHTSRKIYAQMGQAIEVYNTEHWPVMCCRVRDESFPCHIDRLTTELPEEEVSTKKQPIDYLYDTMVLELKKGRTKFKTLVGCIRDGILNKQMPDGITKEHWLLTADKVLEL